MGVLLISARPSMFLVGSLYEFLIPIGSFVRSRRLWCTRAAYAVVNYHLHVIYNSGTGGAVCKGATPSVEQ